MRIKNLQRDENAILDELYKQKQLDFQLDIQIIPFTKMEEKQFNKLKQNAFEWSYQEFDLFLQSCIKYGRKDFFNISKCLGKMQKEVQQYMKVFNQRYEEIQDKIEKTEQQLEQEQEYFDILVQYIKIYDDPLFEMNFNQVYKNTYFTLESDQLIVYAAYIEGFGKWDQIQKNIVNHEFSFFNNYLSTRSISVIQLYSSTRFIKQQMVNNQNGKEELKLHQK